MSTWLLLLLLPRRMAGIKDKKNVAITWRDFLEKLREGIQLKRKGFSLNLHGNISLSYFILNFVAFE